MAHDLLRHHKDLVATKFHLSLFTQTVEDDRALASRLAQLELELANTALRSGDVELAFSSLIAAAAAYRVLDCERAALGLLRQAHSMKAGDDEARKLLGGAIGSLRAKLEREIKHAPKKTERPEPEPEPVFVVEEPKVEGLKVEESETEEKPKRRRRKKKDEE